MEDDPVVNAILSQYFRRLEQSLSGLPADRRRQILEDLRAHVTESLDAEPDHSDASVLAVLDRVGDPDEIAREAVADTSESVISPGSPTGLRERLSGRPTLRLGGTLALAASVVAAVSVVVLTVTGGSSAAPTRGRASLTLAARISGRRQAAPYAVAPVSKGGWLPAGDVSGDHHSPGASDCGPQTVTGSESAATLEANASQVASGSVDGHSWSLWSEDGESGSDALENGGIVVDGTAYGLCPGFPNPAEMELLEPSGGGQGLAYGVVGYPGAAKIDIYQGTAETFEQGKRLATAAAQVVNGVAFFITAMPGSACAYPSLEMNTTSGTGSTEHNLGFATSDCAPGQLVPINWSQGIWGLAPGRFHNGSGGRGGAYAVAPVSKGGWLPAGDVSGDHHSPGASDCGPQTVTGSESAATLEANASQVASGSVDGHSWSLWSEDGESGSDALENGGIVVDGTAYGLCPGFPNPAEMELLEPSGGGDGIAYGVIGYAGSAKVAIYRDTFGAFATGPVLATATAQSVNGVGFFITALSQSACDVPAVELNTASDSYAAEHNLAFSASHCSNGQLVPISDSQGVWQLPTSDFPNRFQSLNGGEGSNSTPTLPVTMPDSHKVASVLLNRYRILRTSRVPAATLPSNLVLLRVAGLRLGLDTSA